MSTAWRPGGARRTDPGRGGSWCPTNGGRGSSRGCRGGRTPTSSAAGTPAVAPRKPQGLRLDGDYDGAGVYAPCDEFGFTAHVRRRGEEAAAAKRSARKKARRWVDFGELSRAVERTHS